MSYYRDLEPQEVCGARASSIGWLDGKHDFPAGEAGEDFFRALVALLVDPWTPAASAGVHFCPFCRFTGGPGAIAFEGVHVVLGTAVLYVPGPDALFAAPSLIAHYIDAHAYRPPDHFIAAVMDCPPMRSMAYLRSIARHGVQLSARRERPDPR